MNQCLNIDFEKYHTFFLEYFKDADPYKSHCVRPCIATYDEITNTLKTKTIYLEGSVLTFDNKTSLTEILMECAIVGVSLDFIDIIAKTDEGKKDRWATNSDKVVQVIDTHKEDVIKYLDKIEAPRYYIALNKDKNSMLMFLVIDRFAQENSVEFLKNEYKDKAVIAGFKNHEDAKIHCANMNNEYE